MAMENCYICTKKTHRECAEEVIAEPLHDDDVVCSENCLQVYMGLGADADKSDSSIDDEVSVDVFRTVLRALMKMPDQVLCIWLRFKFLG